MTEPEDDDFVLVPVPRGRVLDVMAFLSREPRVAPSTGGEGDEATSDPRWDADSIQRLLSDAPPLQVSMLRFLAERPGVPVTAGEMAERLGRRGRAVGAVTKALQQRSRYYSGRSLPFRRGWAPDLGNHYVMPEDVAEAVRTGWAHLDRSDG